MNDKDFNKNETGRKAPLAEIYKEISGDLRQQWSLRFTPPANEGGYHRLNVMTRKSGLTVQARDGYYAQER